MTLISRFKQSVLYAVTDLTEISDDFFDRAETALEAGVDVLQLRSKVFSDRELYKAGLKLRTLTSKYEALFIVNDRVDLAIALEADGVHIGQDDMPVQAVRGVLESAGVDMLVGKSTHSIEQALKTAAEHVDYIGVGPIFATPTKKDYVPVGLELLKEVQDRIKLPYVCIGGICMDNIDALVEAKAERVAVVRAIFNAPDVRIAVQSLREKVSEGR